VILVVDASVALKWFFHTRGNEAKADCALAILSGIDEGRIQLAQPPHFIAEVAAVLTRSNSQFETKLSFIISALFFVNAKPHSVRA
jgi:predicted nucleic acid-binding protein